MSAVTPMAYTKYLNPRPFFQTTFQGNCMHLAPIEYGNFNGRPGPVSGIFSMTERRLRPVKTAKVTYIKYIT